MPYVITRQVPRSHQITLEEIWSGAADEGKTFNYDVTGTVTRFFERVPRKFAERFDTKSMIDALAQFNSRYAGLFEADRHSLYHSFHIPKKTGGLREINAPYPPLMNALRELKELFERRCGLMYHTSAYAYINGRSTTMAVAKHQENKSKWFLKTDFSDFFGSTTLDFTMKMLDMIFPFSQITALKEGREVLRKSLSLCFLNGGLPQGTPISPMLTNLIMIPIDYVIAKELWADGYAYTRYADDILISSRKYFMFMPWVEFINNTLESFEAPFKLKPSKTRYGSSAGSNWNLGVMLNKENDITFGHKNKAQFKAMCDAFIKDMKRGVMWDPHDVNIFSGLLSYYTMVEPDYIKEFIPYINKKHRANLIYLIRMAQRGYANAL